MALICASITGETPGEFLETAKNIDTDLIEIRADGLSDCTPENVHNLLSELKKTSKAKVILTVRKKEEGGHFDGTEEERKEAILGSIHLADVVDIELRCHIRDDIVAAAKANGIDVIISYHDFDKTPSRDEIMKIIGEETELGADYAKVAFMASSLHDVLELLWVTMEMSKKTSVITISMGELGSISRVVAPLLGSGITYASAGVKTAPGQLSVEEMKNILKIMEAAK